MFTQRDAGSFLCILRRDPMNGCHLEAGARLWEASGGGLRGHAGAHRLSGHFWHRQGRQRRRLGKSLEDGAWLGEATCMFMHADASKALQHFGNDRSWHVNTQNKLNDSGI